MGAINFEVSAKENQGIEDVFLTVAKLIHQQMKFMQEQKEAAG